MSHLDSEQVEQLKAVGTQLRESRLAQAVTLEEVHNKTYIPLRLLQAIEEGQVEKLPEPVFIQGFIRRYAEFLQLDSTALVRQFNAPLNGPVVRPPSQPVTPLPTSIPREETSQSEDPPPQNPTVPRGLTLLMSLGVLLGLGLAGFYIVRKTAQSQPQVPVVSSPVLPSPSPSPTPSVTPSAPTAPIQVSVALTGDSWMQVTSDGNLIFEGTLAQGTEKSWQAKQKLVLEVGNAGAVSLRYNQGEAKRLGNSGEVKEVTFPPEAQTKSE